MFKLRKLQILLFLMIICLITLLAQSLWSYNTDVALTGNSVQQWKAPGEESNDQDADLIAGNFSPFSLLHFQT